MKSLPGRDAPDHLKVAFVGTCPHCLERGILQAEALLGVAAEEIKSTPVALNELGALLQAARLTVLTDAPSISVLLASIQRLARSKTSSLGAFHCPPPDGSAEREAAHQPDGDKFTARVTRHRIATPYNAGQIVLDSRKGELRKGHFRVRVTPIQSRLLRALLIEPGHWISSASLAESVYGEGHAADESLIRVHVRKLRAVLRAAVRMHALSSPAIQLESARGWGYRLT
jgi:DNA-binding response OmpR family regulator